MFANQSAIRSRTRRIERINTLFPEGYEMSELITFAGKFPGFTIINYTVQRDVFLFNLEESL